MSLHAIVAPTYSQMLGSMQTLLDKGLAYCSARKIEEAALLEFRLYPDMFPFVRQVQAACDHASGSCQRLGGVEAVRPPRDETSFDALKQRVAKALDVVQTISAETMDANAERDLSLPMGSRQVTMKGRDYIVHFAFPNFYFHHTAAYSILRHNGIEVGKRDFLGTVPGL